MVENGAGEGFALSGIGVTFDRGEDAGSAKRVDEGGGGAIVWRRVGVRMVEREENDAGLNVGGEAANEREFGGAFVGREEIENVGGDVARGLEQRETEQAGGDKNGENEAGGEHGRIAEERAARRGGASAEVALQVGGREVDVLAGVADEDLDALLRGAGELKAFENAFVT